MQVPTTPMHILGLYGEEGVESENDTTTTPTEPQNAAAQLQMNQQNSDFMQSLSEGSGLILRSRKSRKNFKFGSGHQKHENILLK